MFQIGVYDVNIGLCEDTLTIEDSSGVSTKFLPTDNVSKGRKLISKSGKIDLKLSTCFHYGKTKRKAFEINVSVTGIHKSPSFKCEQTLDFRLFH